MALVGIGTVLGPPVYADNGSNGVVTSTSLLVSTITISTSLISGSLSDAVSEYVGAVNIAIEGDLPVGAFAGIMAASFSRTPHAGITATPLVGALLGSLLAFFSAKYGVD